MHIRQGKGKQSDIFFLLLLLVISLRDVGALYSRFVLYFHVLARLQLIAIFEPSVGGQRVSRGLTLHCELASLVHSYWNPDGF